MILIALGGNLPSPDHGPPRATLTASVAALARNGITVEAWSRWYRTQPVPISDQPWFINAMIRVTTRLDPPALLECLHRVEAQFGRVRSRANAARLIDLDLIDYDGQIRDDCPILPHPRLGSRAFVLRPLLDLAPDWRHPVTGVSATDLLAAVDPGQVTELDPD